MNVPEELVQKWAAQLGLARENTRRVEDLIRAHFNVPPGTDLAAPAAVTKSCEACGGRVALNLAETVIASRPGLELHWDPCPECSVRSTLLHSGVPLNLIHCRFENWTIKDERDRPEFNKAVEFTRSWVGFLAIESPTFGNGKSHLAVAIARRAIEEGRRARFITQAELLRAVRDRYDDSRAENIVSALKRVPLLVLDDMGFSVGGRDETPTLHEVLAHRYGERRPTVMTMNISREQFRDAIGQRVADRLREATFAWAVIHGDSFRAGRRKTYLSEKLEAE